MDKKWSKERIWEWYNSRPWIRGCNYMSADCANRVDQWQSLGFEQRLETTKAELELAHKTGYNSIRIILEYIVWKEEHDTFFERFDRYLDVCAQNGISCMVVLANDCMPPKTELWKPPYIGEQTFDIGYHGGKKHSQHGRHTEPAEHFYLDFPDSAESYFSMVTEIVERYKNDERIIIWDVYNEPGNNLRRNITLPNLKRMFETIRAIDPIQPLTCAAWSISGDESVPINDVEAYALENSDIISYHSYSTYTENIRLIKRLKKYGRPILNTEWLGRCLSNNVAEMFPLFYLEKIGCYNWGFVAGKYQTFEPWEATWINYYENKNQEVDFTKWFHDLYRPNHRPYDPKEIELIKHFCDIADDDFKREQEGLNDE